MKARLAAEARDLGFDLCRVCAPDSIPDAPARLRAFLEAGFAGDMGWLEATEPRRADPRVLWPEVRGIVMLGLNYGPEDDPLAALAQTDRATISVYARGRDYHEVIKGKLKQLASWLLAQARHDGDSHADVKVFVDTAPVMEKPLAQAAGLGWQGKHTNLVSRELGSWLFLGAIFTTLPLTPDAAEVDHCGSCRACLDACPTNAFPAPYTLDARRCISYLTIEHQGSIPHALRAAIGNRIFGCDDCLAVCPWNKWARAGRETKLAARAALTGPRLADLLALDEAGFRRMFAGTPVRRLGFDRFKRNVLIAAGNSREARLAATVDAHRADTSEVVREAADWAVRALADATAR